MKIIDGQQVPEVGDVWKHNKSGFIFRITYIKNELYKWAEVVWENGHVDSIYYGGFFANRYSYLGKNKEDIKQLFEVDDE